MDSQLQYWKTILGNAQSLKLPNDFTRNTTEANIYNTVEQSVTTELKGKENFVLALYAILLTRFTNEEDYIIATVEATSASSTSVKNLVHIALHDNPVFATALANTENAITEAQANTTEVSLAQVIATVFGSTNDSKILDNSNQQVFQVSFSAIASTTTVTPSLLLQKFCSSHLSDLHLNVDLSRNALQLTYAQNLYSVHRAREALNQLQFLAQQINADPQKHIFEYSLVTPESAAAHLPDPRAVLDNTWEGAIFTHFEKHAATHPDRIAILYTTRSSPGNITDVDIDDNAKTIVTKTVRITYQRLNELSNQFARQLLDAGLRRQEIVSILGHRSPAIVVAVMGILKAGASFNILDPAYPPSRLIDCLRVSTPAAFVLIEDAGQLPEEVQEYIRIRPSPREVVSRIDYSFPETGCRTRFTVQIPQPDSIERRKLFRSYSTANLDIPIGADDIAVVTFTSGSTGMPKGVLGRHGPLTHYYPYIRDTFNLTEEDRFSMQSGISHDPLQRDIFTPLFLGATIHIPDTEDIVNPGRLLKWFAENEISVTHLTPAMGQLLAETSPEDTNNNTKTTMPKLRYAFFVGDVLTKKFVTRLHSIAPNYTCINLYGSTETQRSVTYFPVPKNGTEEFHILKDFIPCGKGMRDIQGLVLAKYSTNLLAGVGEMGEIYMRSPHLAAGYKDLPEETAQKFIVNPFTNDPRDRMYRTGDLGRYLPLTGDVECNGRADDQIKIRGFRIELGEINTALINHPMVKEAVTVARADLKEGEKRIVSYVVLLDQSLDTKHLAQITRDLRKYVKSKLPDYMVPSAFCVLPSLPLTPNGKVNRAALPSPSSVMQADLEEAYVAPRSPLEAQLCQIWSEVLGVARVGVHDNFFELGGHSIAATKMTFKIRQYVDGAQTLPVELLFQAPTVGSMAVAIGHIRSGHDMRDIKVEKLVRDLYSETHLDEHIRPTPAEIAPREGEFRDEWINPRSVLITGCTGFLGAFLLKDIAQFSTATKIYCLVRAKDEDVARKRIKDCLVSHLLWSEPILSKVVPVVGDLAKPRLGLSQEMFEELSHKVDFIMHNGALVHWMYPYEKMKAANVDGTKEILRLAMLNKIKPVHYVSTTSVFDSIQYSRLTDVFETSDLPYHEDLKGGYAQSKYVAEKLVMHARSRGLPAVIYRAGYITGHSRTGVWNPDDFLCRLIKGCIQLGVYPDLPTTKLDMSPVDFVSRAIQYLSLTKQSTLQHKAYHMVNPNEFFFNDLFVAARKFGYELERVDFETWKQRLFESVEQKDEKDQNALYPLLTYFTEDFGEKMRAKRPWYDNTHELEGLHNSGIICPQVHELMGTYYSFLCECGFMLPPQNPTEFALQFPALVKVLNTLDTDADKQKQAGYAGLMRTSRAV